MATTSSGAGNPNRTSQRRQLTAETSAQRERTSRALSNPSEADVDAHGEPDPDERPSSGNPPETRLPTPGATTANAAGYTETHGSHLQRQDRVQGVDARSFVRLPPGYGGYPYGGNLPHIAGESAAPLADFHSVAANGFNPPKSPCVNESGQSQGPQWPCFGPPPPLDRIDITAQYLLRVRHSHQSVPSPR